MRRHVTTVTDTAFNKYKPTLWPVLVQNYYKDINLRVHKVQTESVDHPASYPNGTGDSFSGVKVAEV
jgi:hypothetical protein